MKHLLTIIVLISFFNINNIFAFSHFDDNVTDLISSAHKHMYQNPAEAVKYAISANEKALEIKDTLLIFDAKVTLASSYSINGNYDLALDEYLEAEMFLNNENVLDVADFNINMANMYLNLNNTYKSHRYNNNALEIYEECKDSLSIGWSLNLKGLIFIAEKDYENAKLALDTSLYINQCIKNEEGIHVVINNMALIPGDESYKIELLKNTIVYNESKNNTWSLAENYNNLGLLYYRINKFEIAKNHLNKAKNLADSLNANVLKRDNLRYWTKIAVKENKYKDAYESILEIYEIDEIIKSTEKIEQIEEQANEKRKLINLFNLQQKDNEIRIAQKEKTILFVSGTLFLIIVVLSIRIFHLRKVNRLKLKTEKEIQNKVRLKIELENKNNELNKKDEILNISQREMTNLVYFIKSKDKLLDNIINSLQEIQKKPSDDTKVKIKYTIASIKSFKEKEIKSNLFINEINKTEQIFLENLNNNFPDLTKNEIELATLLRIGLSSKEIALLIDSNPKTVNMARYRLRKKMNLESDENLVTYFEML